MINEIARTTRPPQELRKVLYLDHTAKIGGGEIALLNLLCTINRERYTPLVVLASDGPLADRLRDNGIETEVLSLGASVVEMRKDTIGVKSLFKVGQALSVIRYAFKLSRLLHRRKIQLIHANSLKSDIYGGIAGLVARVPVIWHVRDNIDDQYLPHAVAVVFRLLARLIPRVVIANSESTLRRLEQPARKPSAVVYSGVRDGAAKPQVHIVHDGTKVPDAASAAAHASLPLVATEEPIVVLVGRIAPWKGQHVFIDAAASVLAAHPAATFWIVGAPLFGEHDYERSLHALAAKHNIVDRVNFLGFRDDIRDILAKATVVVHASTLGEPFGQVVIEGMAAGKPIVATDGGALPEIVQSGTTGLLVPMDNAPDMANAITLLLSDPAYAAQMGRAGQAHVTARFTIEQTARKVEAIYDMIFDSTGFL